MSDTDNSSPIVRYNLVLNQLEYFNGSDWYQAANRPAIPITPNLSFTQHLQDGGTSSMISTTWATFTPSYAITHTASSNTAMVRISLCTDAFPWGPPVGKYYLTVFKDGVNMCPGGSNPNNSFLVLFNAATTFAGEQLVNIELYEVPGDTSPHTYDVRGSVSTDTTNGFGISDGMFVFSATEIH